MLDYRVSNLEENGGGNANITGLENRVSDLEVATEEQETRIATNQENIEGNVGDLKFHEKKNDLDTVHIVKS